MWATTYSSCRCCLFSWKVLWIKKKKRSYSFNKTKPDIDSINKKKSKDLSKTRQTNQRLREEGERRVGRDSPPPITAAWRLWLDCVQWRPHSLALHFSARLCSELTKLSGRLFPKEPHDRWCARKCWNFFILKPSASCFERYCFWPRDSYSSDSKWSFQFVQWFPLDGLALAAMRVVTPWTGQCCRSRTLPLGDLVTTH